MVRKRVLDPLPLLDESLLLEAFRAEGVKEVHVSTIYRHLINSMKSGAENVDFDSEEC